MPQALVDKIKKAATFNQGYALTELLAAAALDMQLAHAAGPARRRRTSTSSRPRRSKKTGVDLPQVPPRYRSSYFLHIWGNGYAAGYYAYLWTEMLDDDAFAWFQEHGGLTRANGQRFRDMILSRGNTEDYGQDVPRLPRPRPEHRADARGPRAGHAARPGGHSARMKTGSPERLSTTDA